MYTLSIQSSFEEVINDVVENRLQSDQFWINFVDAEDVQDGTMKEEIVTVFKDHQNIMFNNDNGLKFHIQKEHMYKVEYEGNIFNILSPSMTYKSGLKNTTTFDISPNKELLLIGNRDGDLRIVRTLDGGIERTIEEAHFAEVTKSLFFPSGQVGLTASLDFSIKIWDIASGANPRTFLSHKERITDLAMIGKGRNFVSSSLDGFIKLWDCASGTNFNSFKRKDSFKDGVTSLSITTVNPSKSPKNSPKNAYEFDTDGKRLLAGYVSGVICAYDLASKDQIFTTPSFGSEVVGIWSNDNTILSGHKDGYIANWDIRDVSKPLTKFKSVANPNLMAFSEEFTLISHPVSALCGISYRNAIFNSPTPTILSGVCDEPVVGLKVMANERYVGSENGDIHLYDD